MRRRTAAACLLTLACPLAACGSGGDKHSAAASAGTSAPATASSTWDCSPTSTLSQEDWVKHCQGVDNSTAGATGSALKTVKVGTPFEMADPRDPNSRQTITVKGVECGLAKLPGGAPNPQWNGSNTIPQTVTATPDPGMTFCRITASWQNTGKKPIVGWTDFENLVTADGTEFAEDQKAEQATNYINHDGMPSHCAPYLCGTINPGSPAFDIVKIYQVPTGTQPAAVRWPRATIDSGPAVQFALQ